MHTVYQPSNANTHTDKQRKSWSPHANNADHLGPGLLYEAPRTQSTQSSARHNALNVTFSTPETKTRGRSKGALHEHHAREDQANGPLDPDVTGKLVAYKHADLSQHRSARQTANTKNLGEPMPTALANRGPALLYGHRRHGSQRNWCNGCERSKGAAVRRDWHSVTAELKKQVGTSPTCRRSHAFTVFLLTVTKRSLGGPFSPTPCLSLCLVRRASWHLISGSRLKCVHPPALTHQNILVEPCQQRL